MLLVDVKAMWLWWLIINAIVTDVKVTLYYSGWWKSTFCNNWWSNDCDRWKVTYGWQMLWPEWQMKLPHFIGWCYNHVADGTATCVTADVVVAVADGIVTYLNGWCHCCYGRWNSHIGWKCLKADVIAYVALWQTLKSLYIIVAHSIQHWYSNI